MPDSAPKKITFTYSAILTVIRHSLRFSHPEKGTHSPEVKGILTGEKRGDTLIVTGAVPISHTDVQESPPDDEFFREAEDYRNAHGVSIVGWYHSHPGTGPFFTRKDRLNHFGFISRYLGTVSLLIDPLKIGAGAQFGDYLRVFVLPHTNMGADSPALELRNITVRADFGDVVESVVEMLSLERSHGVPIKEEGEELKKQLRAKKVEKVPAKKKKAAQSEMEVIDRLADSVLRLKVPLAKIKKKVDSHTGLDISGITKEMKALKLRQITLYEKINRRINRTSNIQARIALYRIRDSLGQDMRRLDNLINEQYINTLAELTREGIAGEKKE